MGESATSSRDTSSSNVSSSFIAARCIGFHRRDKAIYPGNHNVRPKIRQQLQVLRDRGWLAFNGRGTYRRTT
ncbi:hypothetical protein [Brevundimonas subvibrioides]|uniref:hypothetical protein n=1 Tax=Brevundimonas subvibrioides TaxID=74313 RepID=UPI003B21F382